MTGRKGARAKQPKLHPLLLEDVVENMLSFVPDSDMNSCRLVCKLWKEEVSRTEKKRHEVKVTSEEEVGAVLRNLKRDPDHRVSSLYIDEFSLDNPLFQELVRRLAPNLSTFRVEDCKVASIATLHGMIRSFPNLVKLVLGTVKTPDNLQYYRLFPIYGPDGTTKVTFPDLRHLDYISYNPPAPPTLLSSVVRTFPNLITLTAKNLYKEDPSKYMGLALPALKKLHIFMVPLEGLQNSHVECFMKLNLTLKELRIEGFSEDFEALLLRAFIESQADTLEHLTLEQLTMEREPGEVPICPFPINVPNLIGIAVGKTFIRNLVHVLNSSPKLMDILFPFVKTDNWAGILPKKIPEQKNIRIAVFPCIDAKSFDKLAKAFTGLTSLKLHDCSDQLLQVIFKELVTLKILILFDGEEANMTDLGFTGICVASIVKSLSEGGQNPFLLSPTELGHFLRNQRKTAYIGNLKDLEYLALHFDNPPTDFIIANGILHLESLRHLYIRGLELSEAMIEAVGDHNNLTYCPRNKSFQELYAKHPENCESDPESVPKYFFVDISYDALFNF